MRGISNVFLAGALLLAASAGAALAADMPMAPPLEPLPEAVEFGSNWYLRGDVGYKIYRTPNVSYRDPVLPVGNYRNEHLDDAGVIGGGVGYKFNNWLRADITADYETPADFKGRARCLGCFGGGYSNEFAKISAVTALVNGYIDLGTWSGLTPYVGAGVGAANVKITDYHFRNPNGTTGSWNGDSKWNFSYALMGGVAFALTPNILIDANYRYLSLGDGQTARLPIGSGRTAVKFDDLAAHEVRVGFRYMID